MQNERQYDFDRKTAKISALFSNNLEKYEHLTVNIWILSQALFNKLNLSIFHWLKLLLRV